MSDRDLEGSGANYRIMFPHTQSEGDPREKRSRAPHSMPDARPIGVEIPASRGTILPMDRASDVLTGASSVIHLEREV